MHIRSLSLRTKFLLIVLVGAVGPLALIGTWVARSTVRSGEQLLRTRLDASVASVVQEIGARWIVRRGQLLDLAESDAVQLSLGNERRLGDELSSSTSPSLPAFVAGLLVRDSAGTVRSTLADAASRPTLPVSVAIHQMGSGRRLGTLQARVELTDLLPATAGWRAGLGSVLGLFDPISGASLLPLPFRPELLAQERFAWGGEEWITARRTLRDPPLQLVAAAPVTPYTEPFTRAARQGTLALLAVAFLAFVVSSLLARQSTRSLERLAEATEAVSRGNFDQQVQTTGADDVGRVGRAFNTMTESLRRTLDELARRESLAKVGEFAAILAHEVRNPLTSIRINLQRMEEQVTDEAELREPLSRVLGQIERLNATVTGALRVARSGTIRRARIDLRTPLAAAIQAATPQFNTREARLNPPALDGDPVYVDADPDALEQLFVNLLFNAAEALDHGGEAEVRLDASSHEVIVSISDSGRGIPPSDRARVLELFYSTKPEGTGLGLAIARRIALAHGGDLEIDDDPRPGTTIRVRLPIRVAGA